MLTARGPLEVNVEAGPPFLEQDGVSIVQNLVRKEFFGQVVGLSEARMIAAHTATPGSAGYVAIEHFTGSVGGRSGSFVLQHHGLVEGGEATLTVTIMPDSGTGEPAGISGALEIDNQEAEHSYILNFTLP